MRSARLRCLIVFAVACRGESPPSPTAPPPTTPSPPVAAAPDAAPAPPAPDAAPAPAPAPPPPPAFVAKSHYRVTVVPLTTPYGDVNAPHFANKMTKLLRDLAAARGTLVSMPDPFADCVQDIRPCAVAAGKRARADVVIYGTLVNGTTAGVADVQLESVAIPSEIVRTWEESISDPSSLFFDLAAQSAYAVLVEKPPPPP